jgi:hypothetical protein
MVLAGPVGSAEDATMGGESGGANAREKWIGVYIGILAVILAIASTGGGNAAKEAAARNIEASNLWAFFQAKNMRRTSYQLAAEDLETMLAANADWSPEAKAAAAARMETYRKTIATLTSDKQRNEGLDELFVRAKAVEKQRDIALERDPYFDYAEALLQIAIVLASVAIISGGNFLLVFSVLLGGAGAFMGFNGFTLMYAIPFIQ